MSYSPTTTSNANSLKCGPIGEQWKKDDAARQPQLERARLCAALTMPWYLPPLGHTPDQKLPQNYQSIGSRGVMTMKGKWMAALWPVDRPWFHLDLAGHIKYDPRISDEAKQADQGVLFMQELIIQAKLESRAVDTDDEHNGSSAFRTGKGTTIGYLIALGDTLEQMTDDYRIKNFRLDQYVTLRNSSGDVLYHIVREQVDPKALSDDAQTKADLPSGWLDKPVAERMAEMYTRTEWQPYTKVWKVEQELNGKVVNTSEEKVTQFFSTPYDLAPGENYGRGFIEANLGDLSSLDVLGEKELDFAAMCSKLTPVLDNASEIRDKDLAKKTGVPIRGRVQGGVWQDGTFAKVDKTADFQVVFAKSASLRKELGAAMLIESELTPRGDRVTAYQAERVAMEVDYATGGSYAPVADYQQGPLLKRTIFQLKRDGKLPQNPKRSVEVKLVTGIAALTRASQAADLQGLLQTISAFPDMIAEFNQDVLLRVLMRYRNISEPGLLKSPAQKEQEQKAAMAQQIAAAAAGKGIDTAGNIIEANATPPLGNAQGQVVPLKLGA